MEVPGTAGGRFVGLGAGAADIEPCKDGVMTSIGVVTEIVRAAGAVGVDVIAVGVSMGEVCPAGATGVDWMI